MHVHAFVVVLYKCHPGSFRFVTKTAPRSWDSRQRFRSKHQGTTTIYYVSDYNHVNLGIMCTSLYWASCCLDKINNIQKQPYDRESKCMFVLGNSKWWNTFTFGVHLVVHTRPVVMKMFDAGKQNKCEFCFKFDCLCIFCFFFYLLYFLIVSSICILFNLYRGISILEGANITYQLPIWDQ